MFGILKLCYQQNIILSQPFLEFSNQFDYDIIVPTVHIPETLTLTYDSFNN